jgi:hypothetical protein
MYGMTIAMQFKKMQPGVKVAKKWFAARCLGLVHHHYCRWNRRCCQKLRCANASWQQPPVKHQNQGAKSAP